MICWNCGKEVPKGARSCKYCESKVEDLPDMSREELGQMLTAAGVDENILKKISEHAGKAGSEEEFADAIFGGDCPKCGS